jgi:CheY-like chemotaxis protein
MARVLVAEDEAFTALAVVEALEELGHVVAEASDGEGALALIASFHPDVLVTDLMMASVDGGELVRRMRQALAAPIPVILITGVPQTKLPDDLAYDAYLGKPIDHEMLGRLVEQLTA